MSGCKEESVGTFICYQHVEGHQIHVPYPTAVGAYRIALMNAEGNAQVRLGRYIGENAYTDVQIGSDGEAEASINLDLTPNITARGSFSSDGQGGIGVFFERDY